MVSVLVITVVEVVVVMTAVVALMVLMGVGVSAEPVVVVSVKAVGPVVGNDLMGPGGVIVMLVEVLAMIDVANAVAITLDFAVSISWCSVDVLPDTAVGLLLMDMLVSVLTVVIIGGLPDIGVNIFVDVNVNAFAGVMTVKFAMSAPLEGFSR